MDDLERDRLADAVAEVLDHVAVASEKMSWRIPLTETIASFAFSPAASAGESGSTTGIVIPTYGAASQAIEVKMTSDRSRFITTPATRMITLTGSRARDERARVVGVVAVLALELDEAADRQPVQRVERLAARPQDLRPGGKPIPNSRTRIPARRARRSGRARGSGRGCRGRR